MGAEQFITTSSGRSPQEAFNRAVEEAAYECGHGGYTGTIAEKESFVLIDVPEGESPQKFANRLMDEDDPRIDDKWGPAGAVVLTGPDKVSPETSYIFFGWASS